MSKDSSSKNGWVSVHRSILNSELWTAEKFTRGQAWIDLILLTNHADGFIRVAGEKVPIGRGQCGWSQLRLAKKWGWSRGRVSRFLAELKQDNRITVTRSNRTSIITICNYSRYQGKQLRSDTTDCTSDSTTDEATDRATDGTLTIRNNKNIINTGSKKSQTKAIKSLEQIEQSELDGHYKNWFAINTPDVDRFDVRQDLITYCRANGRKYKDYWAALQGFAKRRQIDINNKRGKSLQSPLNNAAEQLENLKLLEGSI